MKWKRKEIGSTKQRVPTFKTWAQVQWRLRGSKQPAVLCLWDVYTETLPLRRVMVACSLFNKSCCVILKWIAGGRNGWIIFSKHKEVFWNLEIWKKKKRSKSCKSLNTRQPLPLAFPGCVGRRSWAGAPGRQSSAEESRCPIGAGTTECPAPSSLSSSACRDFYMKLNLIIKLDWGRETLQSVFILVDMPTRYTWKPPCQLW